MYSLYCVEVSPCKCHRGVTFTHICHILAVCRDSCSLVTVNSVTCYPKLPNKRSEVILEQVWYIYFYNHYNLLNYPPRWVSLI